MWLENCLMFEKYYLILIEANDEHSENYFLGLDSFKNFCFIKKHLMEELTTLIRTFKW